MKVKHYNPICYSLHTDDVTDVKCLKRRFIISNFIESRYEEIFVCAEYFRLLYDKHKYGKETYYRSTIEKAILEAISKYIPYFNDFNTGYYSTDYYNKFEHLKVNVLLIDRPYITLNIEIHKAFEIILENPKKCRWLKEEVFKTLYDWHNKKTLKKDAGLVKLLKQSFGVENKITKYNKIHAYGEINENAFIDLIVKLTNKN